MSVSAQKQYIGFFINPYAGIGGAAGLKGSDGRKTLEAALSRGGRALAFARAEAALLAFRKGLRDQELSSLLFLAPPGTMGADALKAAGLPFRLLPLSVPEPSTAADTMRTAEAFLFGTTPPELILFAGGDGTARDLCSVIGRQIPVVGIPAGVKMYSAVFAYTPREAGQALSDWIHTPDALRKLSSAEVMDIDEAAFRRGQVLAKLFGSMQVPLLPDRIQTKKLSGMQYGNDAESIAEDIVSSMEPGVLYLIGPGSTTMELLKLLKLPGTLLGVDAVKDKRLLGTDLSEQEILQLLAEYPDARIILTPIGGQGMLLGRGNQQLSPAVLRKAGTEHLLIAATEKKLLDLAGKPLHVDTGDEELNRSLAHYHRLLTGFGRYTMYPVGV